METGEHGRPILSLGQNRTGSEHCPEPVDFREATKLPVKSWLSKGDSSSPEVVAEDTRRGSIHDDTASAAVTEEEHWRRAAALPDS